MLEGRGRQKLEYDGVTDLVKGGPGFVMMKLLEPDTAQSESLEQKASSDTQAQSSHDQTLESMPECTWVYSHPIWCCIGLGATCMAENRSAVYC